MPDDTKLIAVDGVGNVAVPTSWSDDQIHDAMIRQFPPKPAVKNAAAAQMDNIISAKPFGVAPAPTMRPNFGTLPLPSAADVRAEQDAQVNLQYYGVRDPLHETPTFENKSDIKLPAWTDRLPHIPQKSLAPEILARVMSNTAPEGSAPISGDQLDAQVMQSLAPFRPEPNTITPQPSRVKEAVKGVGRGLWGAAKGMTTPENVAMIGGMALAPETAMARVSPMISELFGTQMVMEGGKDLTQIPEAVRKEGIGGGFEKGTQGLFNLGMAGLSAMHPPADTGTPEEKVPPVQQPLPTTPQEVRTVPTTPQPSLIPDFSRVQESQLRDTTPTLPIARQQVLDKLADDVKDGYNVGIAAKKITPEDLDYLQKRGINYNPKEETLVPSRELLNQPQAPNPSLPKSNLPEQEDTLRKLVGQNIRIRQLSSAAKNRLQVEFALRDSAKPSTSPAKPSTSPDEVDNKGKDAADAWLAKQGIQTAGNSIVSDPTKTFDSLDRGEKTKVAAVAGALDIKPKQLQQQSYYLTDQQIDQLKSMRSQGLRPFSLKTVAPDHPEVPFGEYAHYPLADINEQNAKAAGIAHAKDLKSQLSPEDRQSFKDFKSQYGGAEKQYIEDPNTGKLIPNPEYRGVSSDLENSSEIVGEQKAKASGTVTQGGKDAETLQFEHDMYQKVLSKRLQQVQAALVQRLPAWKEARASETEPSPLAQQINSLSRDSKAGIPKDLYAPEHLGTDATKGVPSPTEPQPVQGTKTTPPSVSTEGSAGTKPQGESTDLLNKIAGLANDIQDTHGDEAHGALQQIFGAVSDKYKNPDYVNKALYASIRKYKVNLDNRTPNPMDSVLEDIKNFPQEKEGSTLYANPIGPMLKKVFGPRETPVLKGKFPGIGEIPELPIAKLTEKLDTRETPTQREQLNGYFANETKRFLESWNNAPETMKQHWNTLDTFFKGLYNMWAYRPGLNAIDAQMGVRDLTLLKASIELKDFNERFNTLHPKLFRQAAMTAYEEAGGGRLPDAAVFQKLQGDIDGFNLTRFVNKAHNAFYKVYSAAQNLTPEEKQSVEDYREYRARMETREKDLGLNHEVVEDYLQHIWSRDNFALKTLKGIQSGRGFGTTANFQRMRTFETYAEGILQGFKPKDLSMGYLITARAQASARVIANRALVKALYDTKMPDGKDALMVEGYGTHSEPNPTETDKTGALYIKKGLPVDAVSVAGDPYQTVNHPAFQNLKWVGTTKDGTTILYKGSAVVHPDAAAELKRVLEPSKLAEPLKIPLAISTMAKNTLLVGFFHPVQLGVHLLEHASEGIGFKKGQGATNSRVFRAMIPWSNEKFIDLNDAKQQMMIIHGLQLRLFDAENIADEGVLSGGFVRGLPYAGGLWRAFHDSMFTKLIPNMKMSMGLDMLDRNMTRYHDKYTLDELKRAGLDSNTATQKDWGDASTSAQSRIYRMSAEQTNAAFGGINWRTIPGGKTFRDVLRLTVLAPDFLLARMQFAGDAFRPGGAESARALLTGAFLQYAAARYINSALNNGDPKWDIHDWNRIVYKHNAISLRTQESDMTDAFLDWRTFFSHRMNPITIRPVAEMIGQHDIFGHPANAGQQMFDFVKNMVPMPAQGLADAVGSKFDPRLRSNKDSDRIADNFITAMTGVRLQRYRTPAEREVFSQFDAIQGAAPDSELSMEQHNKFNELRDAWKSGKLTPTMVQDALNSGKLKPSEVRYLRRTAHEPQLVSRARQLQLDQVYNAWKMGDDAQKIQLTPLILAKLSKVRPQTEIQDDLTIPKVGIDVPNMFRSTEPASRIRQSIYDFRSKLSQDQLKALHQRTRDEIEWENPTPPKPDTQETNPTPE